VVGVEGLEYLVDRGLGVAAAGLEGLGDLVEQEQAGRALGRDDRDPPVADVAAELAGQVTERFHFRDYARARGPATR
jgi:hypothetical protein